MHPRQRSTGSLEQGHVGPSSLDAGKRRGGIDHIAIDRLASQHERRRLERPRPRDSGVHNGVWPALFESAGGLERRLDGADPAAKGVEANEESQFAVGGGDDQHHDAHRISG